MATIVAAAEAMIAAADAADVRLMVGHNWRFHDDVRRLRDRITAGDLGEVVKTRGYGTHVAWGPSGWFTNPALAGGGALLDMGVHAIDTARFLIGDPDPVDVCATVATRYAAGRYAVDDDGILVIRWSSGVRSIVECGWWQPHRGGLEADTEVYGTRGYARIWPASDASLSEADDDHCSQPMYTAQMHEFLSAIEEDREPVPGPANGLAVMRVVEDAYRSADLRQGPPA
jgi:predicted dehydrogenase